jgi:hypothetical protein
MTKLNILYVGHKSLSALLILGSLVFRYTLSSILRYVDRSILTLDSVRYYCSRLIHVRDVCECVKMVCCNNKQYSKKDYTTANYRKNN